MHKAVARLTVWRLPQVVFQICWLGIVLVTLSGCQDPAGPGVQEEEPAAENPSQKTSAPTDGTFDLTRLPEQAEILSDRETWHTNYLQGKKIGYRHTQVRELKLGEEQLLLTNILEKQTLLRFDQKVTLEIKAAQLQDSEGNILQFSYELPPGIGNGPVQGIVEKQKLKAGVLYAPAIEAVEMEWSVDTAGFDGVEQSLLAKPMQPGEERYLEILQIPPLELVGEVRLQAMGKEKTKLPAGEVELLRVEQQVLMPGAKILLILWCDETGQVLKYSIPAMQQETFLTTKEQALSESDAFGFDLGTDLLVRLKDPPEDPHRAKMQSYQVTWNEPKEDGRKLLDLFPSSSYAQEVWTMKHVMIFITIRALRPDDPAELEQKQPEPTAADRQPSSLVQSDDPEIVKLADSTTDGAESDWDKAITLEKFVHAYLTEKNYSQAFASASDVAKSREGDCTEHAVFLAALCRAENIPAQVAYGLVYVPSEKAFAFHMWNEVWIKDRWIPLDGTLALGGIGAGHIKLGKGTSPLADLTALLDLMPIMQTMGKLEIKAASLEEMKLNKRVEESGKQQ